MREKIKPSIFFFPGWGVVVVVFLTKCRGKRFFLFVCFLSYPQPPPPGHACHKIESLGKDEEELKDQLEESGRERTETRHGLKS